MSWPSRQCGMEASEPTCPVPSARDQPAPTPGTSGGPGGHVSPCLTLGPVILPPEQGLTPTVFLKALPVPLYHTVPPGSLQPRAPLETGSLEGASVPFLLSPLLQPEGPSLTQVGKPATPALTVNIVGTLPMLSPGPGPALSSTGRVRSAGKYLCPHCSRDCLKPSVLEKHIRSHTGERPFPCATCGIAFKTQSNLYKHRRTQTHLNNARLSLESEGGGNSLLEEGDRPGEPGTVGDEGGPEGVLSPGGKNLDRTTEAAPCSGPTLHQEAPVDSTQMTSSGLSLASPQPRRKLPEPKPCSLQRQQDMCLEKPWDPRTSEGRLRKCESTDSGYLSRSDSAEQPPVASSPLHSLSEHSAESEGEGGPGSGPGDNKAEQGVPGTSLELEKKKLEERIAQLISHNQAVVDDPQLDHVRPRKTVLSKQGSIDLPMPYTYKDSFHFDLRAPEPSRRRTALSPAHSTITPLEKSRPLFFHSVPTQLSTTAECVPVTRSNSLPFIEGSQMWPEPRDPQDAYPRVQKPLSPRLASARPGCHPGLTLADIPSSHPRALVRQAAVEDLLCTPTGDPMAAAEDSDRMRAGVREGTVCKGRVSKKYGQKKPKMFSQEKWQVYGDETFKRIYQKMKTGQQGGQTSREVRQGQGTERNLSTQEELARSEDATPSQDGGAAVLGDSSTEAKPGSWENRPVLEGSSEAGSPKQLKAVDRAKSSPTLGSKNTPCLSSRSLRLPPSEKLGCQLTPVPGPLQGVHLEAPRLTLPDSRGEATKETCSWAQTVLRQCSVGDPQPAEDKFPSERKRLKVDGLGHQGQPELPGEESSGSSVQAVFRLPQKRDSDPGEVLGGSYESTQQVAAGCKSSDASVGVSDSALRCPGSGDKMSLLPSVPRAPGHPSFPASQPQTPGISAALADDTFAPKYLLRLPQGENHSLPVIPGPEQGPDSLCTHTQSEEQASLAGSALGMPSSPGPCSGSAPSQAEDPSLSRTMDRCEQSQMGREKGDKVDGSTPVSRGCPGFTPGASTLPTHTCDNYMAWDRRGETHAIHYFCTDSPSAIAGTSGGLLNPWTSIQKPGTPYKNALEGLLPDPKARLPACCLFQASHFLASFTRSQEISPSQPKLVWTPCLGTLRSCRAQSSFPSLRAEPQLTWCCLSRSLPLPSEQQKVASGHSALPSRDGSFQDEGSEVLPKSNGGRTKASPGRGGGGGRRRGGGEGGEPMQAPELSYPTVPGTRVQDPVSNPQWKKGLCRRRMKISHGNSKKKLKLHSKRCEGSFWQSRAQLRAKRVYKTRWMSRSCLPHRLVGLEPRGILRRASAEVAGVNLQGEPSYTSTDLSADPGSEERKEDGSREIPESISPATSPETVREVKPSTLKAISPSAGEYNDHAHGKGPADGSGLSLHSNMSLVVIKEDLLPQGKGLDAGLLGTRLLPSQDRVSIDPSLCISPDVPEPSSFGSKGAFPFHSVTSVAASCAPLGVRAARKTLGVDGTESCTGETLAESSSESRTVADSTPQAHLPGRPSPRQRSPGKSHLEIPASGPSPPTSNQEEGKLQADFPSRGQHGCGDVVIQCTASGGDSGMDRAPGVITSKGHVALSDQEPSEVPEASLRSIQKRSLEGMRKQTRVELSDTSSDDEDRLVIEI